MTAHFLLDGEPVPFAPGQTIKEAAKAAGKYIPHLCWHPDFTAHGSCKLCTVKVGGRFATSCTTPAAAGQVVDNHTPELKEKRKTLLQLLFVEPAEYVCWSVKLSTPARNDQPTVVDDLYRYATSTNWAAAMSAHVLAQSLPNFMLPTARNARSTELVLSGE